MGYKLNPNTGQYVYDASISDNSAKEKIIESPNSNIGKEGNSEIVKNATENNASDVYGRGKAKGDYRIRKFGKGIISGIAKNMEGTFFFSEVTHTISPNGYEVDFSIKTKKEYIGVKKSETEGAEVSASEEAGRQPEVAIPDAGKIKYKLDPNTGTYKKETENYKRGNMTK